MQRLAATAMSSIRSYSSSANKEKVRFLTGKFYSQNPGVLPIVVLTILDMAWVGYCTVMGFYRTDIVVTRKSRQQGELTELLIEPVNRKFVTINQTYPPNPELYQAYEDMKCAEERRKEQCEKECAK